MLSLHGEELSTIRTTTINIDPTEPYGFTYAAINSSTVSKQLNNMISILVEMLVDLNPPNGLMLFEQILSDKFTADSLHGLFTLLSTRITDLHGLHRSMSIHSPINAENIDRGFPVHADLFKARALLNIISRNDKYNGGDILLISLKQFSEAMYATHSMPGTVIELIRNILTRRISHDGFDFVFDLIHGDHPWFYDLKEEIETRLICIPGLFGAGYFLVDGQWLHGRTKIYGPVLETRLERLVFDTKNTLLMQSLESANLVSEQNHKIFHEYDLLVKAEKRLLSEQ